MKIKAPQIEVSKEEPFKNDLIGRKENAELLTELVRSTDDPLVLFVNAKWGEGKTTFLRMWRQLLTNSGFKTLYFNAWENDFSDDALVSLIGELELGIEELSLSGAQAKKVRTHLNKVKKFGKTLLKRSIPAALKVATAGIIDTDELIEESVSQLGEKFAEDQIKNYEDSKKTVGGFKKELEHFVEEICVVEQNQKLPLIIFIDELDRCRPPYAVQVIEKAKHFFSVKNIVFVLAADRIQFGHSIRSLYGAGMDVDGYLRRFIDFDYNLPCEKKDDFCKAQFSRFGLDDFFNKRAGSLRYDRSHFIGLFNQLFSILDLTLREQEHCFSLLSLAIRTTPEDYKLYPDLLGVLIVLKVKKPELYYDFIKSKVDVDEVIKYIASKKGGREFLNSRDGQFLEAYLASCRSHDEADRQFAKYNSIANNAKDEIERAKAADMVRFFQTIEFRDYRCSLSYLVKKIDLVSNFTYNY